MYATLCIIILLCVRVAFAVISEDPYCFEIKVAVEDSENEGSQRKPLCCYC